MNFCFHSHVEKVRKINMLQRSKIKTLRTVRRRLPTFVFSDMLGFLIFTHIYGH